MARLKTIISNTLSFKGLVHYSALILGFYICQGLGRYSEALIAFSFLALVSVFLPRLRNVAILGFVSVISLIAMTAQPSAWSSFIPFIAIWLTRQCLNEKRSSGNLFLFVMSLLPALFLSSLTDRDWIAFFLLLAAINAPIFHWKYVKGSIRSILVSALVLALFVPLILIYYHIMPLKKVAYIKSGLWAQAQEKLNKTDGLNMATMYAYSEMVELLQADYIEVDNLDDSYGEAWVIIPTVPFTKNQRQKILSWVDHGGRLILVTDHTNLFGHATILNELISTLHIKTQTDAFFPQDPTASAQVSLHNDFPLKTANSQTGLFLWPTMTAKWVSEPADYSNRNFFGPMRATGTTNYERRIISGAISHGQGQVIQFGDSTIFSNFAIYQPGIIPFLEHLRTSKTMASLYPYLLGVLFAGWGAALVFRRTSLLFVSSFLGLWGVLDLSTTPITWPKYISVYGDPEMLSEWSLPEASFSTAYSFFPISGYKPKWDDQLLNNDYGIWISRKPPLDERWICINPTCPFEMNCIDAQDTNPFQELLKRITAHNPTDWKLPINHPKKIKAGHIWTNDVMGEWWLDNGISKSKQARIEAWLSLIQQKPRNDIPTPLMPLTGPETQNYKLKVNGGDWETVELPKFAFEDASEIYLGRGVSGKVVHMPDGKAALIGTKSMTEGWDVASSWILIPE